MEIEARVEPPKPTMLDYVSHSLESPLVLVACCHRVTLGPRAILLVSHQH